MQVNATRADFLRTLLAAPAAIALPAQVPPAARGWYMPAETGPHERCWMAWPELALIWGGELEAVRADIAAIARAISQFEPVVLAVRSAQLANAKNACGTNGIEYFAVANDDLWMRDTGPSFLVNPNGGLAGSTWNFNGWGNKQYHADDALLAGKVLAQQGIPAFDAPIVTEGGALEVDGEGTLVCTDTSILDPRRNPGLTKAAATKALMGWLGVEKVVWLHDTRPDFWTNGHIDGYAKFIRPGVLLFELSRNENESDYYALHQMLRQLEHETDAKGRRFDIVRLYRPLTFPGMRNPNFDDTYVNHYVANAGVVAPKFGDAAADALARQTLSDAYPGRTVVQLNVRTLSGGGGGIHCATQQEPRRL